MRYRRELGRDRRPNTFRRTVATGQIRKQRFQLTQLPFQRIVIGVGQFRRLFVVVQGAMVVDFGGQPRVFGAGVIDSHERIPISEWVSYLPQASELVS